MVDHPFVPSSSARPGEVVLRDAADGRWLRFAMPRETVVAWRLAEVIPALERVAHQVEKGGAWAAGFVGYEAAPAFDAALRVRLDDSGFPLLWFGLYERSESVEQPRPPSGSKAAVLDWKPSVNAAEFRATLARIKTHIRRGDTYQVNYTFRLHSPFDTDPWDAFGGLAASQGAPYAACVDMGDWVLASASPELFFRLDSDGIVSKPMKGTAARALTPAADRAQAAALRDSEKECAENVMIVDMVRNDLGRIAVDGTVTVARLFDTERYPTLWQMTSTVTARTHAGLVEVFRALFPPASITGAPKVETMRLIAELETAPRRAYTGTVGFVGPDRRMQFNVAIRTLLFDRRHGQAEYGVGSGIVWDAEPDREWAECRTKTRILTTMLPEFRLVETLRWTPDEGYALLERHLRRLADSAEYFDFRFDPVGVRAELGQAAGSLLKGAAREDARPPMRPEGQCFLGGRASSKMDLQDESSRAGNGAHRVRLLLARSGEAVVDAGPLPTPSAAQLFVAVARTPVDSSDPFLYHKTTCRRVYDAARAAHPDCADAIFVNERGEVTESTIANVAVEIEGRLWTPPVACGLLAGTLRAELLERGELAERVMTVAELRRSPRVLLLNSVRGVWPVEVE